MPEKLQQHLVDVTAIEERFDIGDTNLENMLVFHKTASVTDLPVWSTQVQFYQKTQTDMRHRPSTYDGGSPSAPALDNGSAGSGTSAAQPSPASVTAGLAA